MVLTQAGQDILPLIDKVLADAEALQNYKNQLSYKQLASAHRHARNTGNL